MDKLSKVLNKISYTAISKIKSGFYNIISKFKQVVNRIDSNLLIDNEEIKEYGFEDLTPKDDVDKSNTYCRTIDWAIKNENVRNIALSGPYGAGKSSILKTYQKKHNECKYLNISLACFTDTFQENNDVLEKAILQQMFYKVRYKKIPYSRFKKIKTIKSKTIIWNTLLIICATISGFLLFKPEYKEAINIKLSLVQDILNINQIQVKIIIAVFLISMCIIYKRIISYIAINFKINKVKLKVKDQEAEFGSEDEKSIFNKFIDEILYFFEVNKYDVVIFEDLDRFENIEIFSKLRELNNLINNSEQINRKIVFIYAIKDDIFSNIDDKYNIEYSKNRTKFFDFIIPVIPIINSSNSYDMLISRFNESKYWSYDEWNKEFKLTEDSKPWKALDEKFIGNITILINDMRMLNNIYNEFIIYIESLSENGVSRDLNKLLAIIIYKNIYPNDFAKLQVDKGMVYEVFSSETKEIAIKNKIEEIDSKIENLRKNIELSKTETLEKIKELRTICLRPLMERTYCDSIMMNGVEYIIKDLIEKDDKFQLFLSCNDYSVKEYNSYYSNLRWNKISIEDKNISQQKENYKHRKEIIKLKESNGIHYLRKQLDELIQKKSEINSLSVKDLVNKEKVSEIFNKEIENEKLLMFLIKNGYIDEEYSMYITYFYEGNLTKTDRDFITSVLYEEKLSAEEITKQFEYKLCKKEEILNQLRMNDFKKEYILNYDLINYIIEKNIFEKKYEDYYKLIIEQLCDESEKSVSFINEYLYNSDVEECILRINENDDYYYDVSTKEILKKSIYSKWPNMWNVLTNRYYYSEEELDRYLVDILDLAQIDEIERMNIDSELSIMISNMAYFLELNFVYDEKDISKISELLNKLHIKFKFLNKPLSKLKLVDFIYENNLYEINKEMIELIIGRYSSIKIEDLEKCNYTKIKQSNCKYLISYIDDNIKEYIENVFLKLENNIYESEETIISLMNKDTKIIGKENKKAILEKELTIISDITSIHKVYWNIAIEKFRIDSTWENLIEYYKECEELDDDFINFLNKEENCIKLSQVPIKESDNYDEKIAEKMIKEIIICKNLEEKAFITLLESMPYAYKKLDMDNLSNERINNIINCGLLALSIDNFNFLKLKTHNKHITLIIKKIDDYLKDQDKYELDSEDIKQLLTATIDAERKISIINFINVDTIKNDINLMNFIIKFVLQEKYNSNELKNKISEILKNCDINQIESNRIDDMINSGLINLSSDNYNCLREQSSNKHIALILRNIEGFIKNQDEYELDSEDINHLLTSQIKHNDIASIIKNIDIIILSDDFELVDNIIKFIIKQSCDVELDNKLLEIILEYKCNKELPLDILNYILDSKILTISKIKLLSNQSKYLSEDVMFAKMNKLGEPYSKVTNYGKNPTIENSEVNMELLKSLKSKEYISSWNEEEDKLRVYTKRSK
ncbi:hypothetical protein ACN077_23815 [Clostridium chromiireducens]|uniref:YobI family P-loop NTPase n=1 Tax=Clostridium chromiireducens TaxID=225345 RepID=UPI003AF4DE0C